MRFINKKTVATMLSLVLANCAQNKTSSSVVSSQFSMTGSTVASLNAKIYHPLKLNLFDLFINKSIASPVSTLVDSNSLNVTLNEVWIVIKEIEFESTENKTEEETEEDNSSTHESEFKGPYFVDLLSTSPQVLDSKEIPDGIFRRVKLKLEAESSSSVPAGVPSQLATNSIYVVGSVNGNSFTLMLDDGSEMNIGGANAIAPKESASLLVEINLADVFKNIDLSNVTANEVIDHNNRHSSSCPAIDASANDVYTCVRKAIESKANFGRDDDNDGELESSEDSVK